MDDTLCEPINVRFFERDRVKMEEFVAAFPDRYENVSHFVRCAVQYYLRHFGQDWREQRDSKEQKVTR